MTTKGKRRASRWTWSRLGAHESLLAVGIVQSALSQALNSGLNQALNYRKDHGGCHPEHEHSVGCFEPSQQFPRPRHNYIAIAQRGVVHCRVIKSRREVREFTA